MQDPLNADLGRFLRSARERTRPETVGLVSTGQRRVPGLRREEVAALAGMSPTYYTRLEQSQATNASPAVLRAIARALRLPVDDEAYLLKIGAPAELRSVRATSGSLSDYTAMLVGTLRNAAVSVVNHRCDILAWNSLYHQLFAPHLSAGAPHIEPERPNVIRLNFLDPRVRRLYLNPGDLHRSNVAYLRYISVDHRDDPELEALVKQLHAGSEKFRQLWNEPHVENCANGRLDVDHSMVGRLELFYESADLRDGNVIKFYHVRPGSPSEAAFMLLAPDQAAV